MVGGGWGQGCGGVGGKGGGGGGRAPRTATSTFTQLLSSVSKQRMDVHIRKSLDRACIKRATSSYKKANRFGLAVRREAGKQKGLARFRFACPFSSKGCGLWTLSCDCP